MPESESRQSGKSGAPERARGSAFLVCRTELVFGRNLDRCDSQIHLYYLNGSILKTFCPSTASFQSAIKSSR